MTYEIADPPAIPGWNHDEDARNNPTWPIRDIAADTPASRNWTRPPPQAASVEILQSIEYNHRPAVFGTASPPSGVSGALRRLAFGRSESNWWHWLLLIAADRINVVEGIVDDLRRGHIPNIAAEKGLGAELKYNRPAFIGRVGTAVVIGTVTAVIVARQRGKRAAVRHDRTRPRHRPGMRAYSNAD